MDFCDNMSDIFLENALECSYGKDYWKKMLLEDGPKPPYIRNSLHANVMMAFCDKMFLVGVHAPKLPSSAAAFYRWTYVDKRW